LFVIARNSSFQFRDQRSDPRQVGEELGVRYLLDGSIRRAGDHLRVTVRLVDTNNAVQIWASRHETVLGEMFELQDEIAAAVAASIGSEVQFAEIRRSSRKQPRDQNAYDLYLRARAALNGRDIQTAINLLDAAIARSPDYGRAMAVRAWCTTLIGWQFAAPTEEQRPMSLRLAETAIASHDADAETCAYSGYAIGFMSDQARRAISLLEDSTRQCPSFAWAWASLALLESYHGDPDRAVSHANTALNLSPGDPLSFRCDMAICKARMVEGKFAECLNFAKRGLSKSPSNAFLQMCRITCQVELGRLDDARASASRFLTESPEFRIQQWRALTDNWLAWKTTSLLLCRALRSAGLPD
jgi:adenylate cyclase